MLLKKALAPATQRAYERAWARLTQFGLDHSLAIVLPVSVDTIILFVTSLYNEGLPASSIASMLSAVSYFHKLNNTTDPTRDFAVSQMMVTIRRERPSLDTRQPVTKQLLLSLVQKLPDICTSYYENCLFEAMFLTAFSFGLRIGEYTADRAGHNLKFEQIQLGTGSVTLNFQSFKHSSLEPVSHTIQANNTPYCPVKSLAEYVAVRGVVPGPLFQEKSKPVSSRRFSEIFRRALILTGENPKHFSPHSLRIGAASYWASLGYSDVQMKKLGRWKSDANDKYVRSAIVHKF